MRWASTKTKGKKKRKKKTSQDNSNLLLCLLRHHGAWEKLTTQHHGIAKPSW